MKKNIKKIVLLSSLGIASYIPFIYAFGPFNYSHYNIVNKKLKEKFEFSVKTDDYNKIEDSIKNIENEHTVFKEDDVDNDMSFTKSVFKKFIKIKSNTNNTNNTNNTTNTNNTNTITVSDYINLLKEIKLNNLDIENKYVINIYFSTVKNTILKTIKINNNTYDINLELKGGTEYQISITKNKLTVINNGRIIFDKDIFIKNSYNNIDISFDKTVLYNKMEISYVDDKIIETQNKKILDTSQIVNNNVSETTDKLIGFDYNLVKEKVQINIKWDSVKKQFIINKNIKTKNVFKIVKSSDIEFKDENITLFDVLKNPKTVLKDLQFVKKVEIDNNNNTIEYVFKDNSNKYYLIQFYIKQSSQNVDGIQVNEYKLFVKNLYSGYEDLTKIKLAPNLDGNNNTTEFYIQTKDYFALFQYDNHSVRKILYVPNLKMYINNPYTKQGVQWKVLIGFVLDTTPRNGKYYVKPIIRLFWYDEKKKSYFIKQSLNLEAYTNLEIKDNNITTANGNHYIFKKVNGRIDYSRTDYVQ